MTDYFALLQEPRRPWLDPDALKAKFQTLSAAVHPDRVHQASSAEKHAANERFAELNEAVNCLREPKERLLHLLTLETGAKPKEIQNIPNEAMELFAEVAKVCREADAVLAEKSQFTSPLMKVQFFQRGMEWTDKLSALQGRLQSQRAQLLAELKTQNTTWDSAPPIGSPERASALPLARLEQIYRTLSYLTRWANQIQERVVQLSL
ncbi:MAG: DnaJ domain-containing protein [Verrucomicrobiota bacterium]